MVILVTTIAAMGAFFRNIFNLLKKEEYRAGLLWLAVLLLTGMIFYRQVEGWEWLDALYFSVITLTTVGYGDFSPTTPLSKAFTMVYILMGLSIFASFASMLVKEQQERYQKRSNKLQQDRQAENEEDKTS